MWYDEKKNKFETILIPKYFNEYIIQQYNQIFNISKNNQKNLQTYREMISSENTFEMYEGLVGLRRYLADETVNFIITLQPRLQVVFELNILKYIIHIIEYNKTQLILYEALWIIINLTFISNQVIDQMKENGQINCIIQKFSQGDYHDLIIEQLCQIFAYVMAGSEENRNYLFRQGSLKILNNYALEKVKDFKNFHLIKLIARSISNHFRYNLISPLQDQLVSLKIFQKLIQYDFPIETLTFICQSYAQFLKTQPSQIQIIIDLGIIPRIIELIELDNREIFFVNIQILNQILGSDQNHQEYLYGIGIFQCLGRLITKYNQYRTHLQEILQTFNVISLSKYINSRLLSSYELDQLLSFINFDYSLIQVQVHRIIKNLVKAHQDIKCMNLIQNKKIIQLCQILVSRNLIKNKQSNLCKIIQGLCETYLQDERFKEFNEELIDLKHQIMQKLQS